MDEWDDIQLWEIKPGQAQVCVKMPDGDRGKALLYVTFYDGPIYFYTFPAFELAEAWEWRILGVTDNLLDELAAAVERLGGEING